MAVHYEIEGAVAIITLDRPEARNAVDRPTAEALTDVCARFEADDVLEVAVLAGAGGTFCAGADLKAMTEEGRPRARTGSRWTATDQWARRGDSSPSR